MREKRGTYKKRGGGIVVLDLSTHPSTYTDAGAPHPLNDPALKPSHPPIRIHVPHTYRSRLPMPRSLIEQKPLTSVVGISWKGDGSAMLPNRGPAGLSGGRGGRGGGRGARVAGLARSPPLRTPVSKKKLAGEDTLLGFRWWQSRPLGHTQRAGMGKQKVKVSTHVSGRHTQGWLAVGGGRGGGPTDEGVAEIAASRRNGAFVTSYTPFLLPSFFWFVHTVLYVCFL